MINGTVIINGTNVSTTYGVYVVRKGYKELLQWPSAKTVSGNNWQEYDGFEPDLSNATIDNREFTINFVCKGGTANMLSFYDFLQSSPKLELSFTDVGISVDARLVSMPSVEFAKVFNIVSVRFACDDDMEDISATASSSVKYNDLYVIDGKPLSDYGVRVLKGTIKNVIRQADVKPLLTRKSSVINGAEYDENPLLYYQGEWRRSATEGDVTTAAIDVTLRCQSVAASLSQALENSFALLSDLIAVDEGESDVTLACARDIVIRPVGGVFRCYYKSQNVEGYYVSENEAWINFNLTLCLFEQIGTCDIEDGIDDTPGGGGGGDTTRIKALATEDSRLVITEDGKIIVLRT